VNAAFLLVASACCVGADTPTTTAPPPPTATFGGAAAETIHAPYGAPAGAPHGAPLAGAPAGGCCGAAPAADTCCEEKHGLFSRMRGRMGHHGGDCGCDTGCGGYGPGYDGHGAPTMTYPPAGAPPKMERAPEAIAPPKPEALAPPRTLESIGAPRTEKKLPEGGPGPTATPIKEEAKNPF
jgi:hypothetical protein